MSGDYFLGVVPPGWTERGLYLPIIQDQYRLGKAILRNQIFWQPKKIAAADMKAAVWVIHLKLPSDLFYPFPGWSVHQVSRTGTAV